MDSEQTKIFTRALKLTRKYGVAQKDVTGAYYASPNREVEYLFHEVAHWLTLGGDIRKIPARLSNKISTTFTGIPPVSANALEIDASLVTYLAGWTLGYWNAPEPIVKSCLKNLSGSLSLGLSEAELRVKFVNRWTVYKSTYAYKAMVIAKWFRPVAELTPFPEEGFPGAVYSVFKGEFAQLKKGEPGSALVTG